MAQTSAEKLELAGPALPKIKECPQCHKVSSWRVRQSSHCQKEKEQSHQSRSPDREVRESQGEREPHLDERDGDPSGSLGGKMRNSQ